MVASSGAGEAEPKAKTSLGSFRAHYYDGISSKTHDVEVQVEGNQALLIVGEGLARRVNQDEIRISPRLGNTARSIVFIDGAKCETLDNAAVDALAESWGRGRRLSFLHRIESNRRPAVFAVFILAAVIAGGFRWGVPMLATRVAYWVPKAAVYDLGQGTLEMLDATLFKPSKLSDEVQDRLRVAFGRMAIKYPDLPLSLTFRSAHMPNAFALPNGVVVVTDELVELAEKDDEVMAVLAHEIGHVHHRHAIRMALESSTMALLIGAYLGDATQISSAIAVVPTIYAQSTFSQAHETEADEFALAFLKQAGISPRNFVTILEKLTREIGGKANEKGMLRYLASHPPTEERLRQFRE